MQRGRGSCLPIRNDNWRRSCANSSLGRISDKACQYRHLCRRKYPRDNRSTCQGACRKRCRADTCTLVRICSFHRPWYCIPDCNTCRRSNGPLGDICAYTASAALAAEAAGQGRGDKRGWRMKHVRKPGQSCWNCVTSRMRRRYVKHSGAGLQDGSCLTTRSAFSIALAGLALPTRMLVVDASRTADGARRRPEHRSAIPEVLDDSPGFHLQSPPAALMCRQPQRDEFICNPTLTFAHSAAAVVTCWTPRTSTHSAGG